MICNSSCTQALSQQGLSKLMTWLLVLVNNVRFLLKISSSSSSTVSWFIQHKIKRLRYRLTQQKENASKLWAKEATWKKGDVQCKVKGGTNAVCCKENLEVYLFSDVLQPRHVIMWTIREMCRSHYGLKVATPSWILLAWAICWSTITVFPVRPGSGRTVLPSSRPHSPQRLSNSLSRSGTLSHKLFRERPVSGLIHAAERINSTPSTSGS